MKATEQEIIEIELTDKMREFIAKGLKKNLEGLSRRERRALPQYKFLKSVLAKCETYIDGPMLFSARECATLAGWLNADIQLSSIPPITSLMMEIEQIVKSALAQWEENNPKA